MYNYCIWEQFKVAAVPWRLDLSPPARCFQDMVLRGYVAFPRIWHEIMGARSLQGAEVSGVELQDCEGLEGVKMTHTAVRFTTCTAFGSSSGRDYA